MHENRKNRMRLLNSGAIIRATRNDCQANLHIGGGRGGYSTGIFNLVL